MPADEKLQKIVDALERRAEFDRTKKDLSVEERIQWWREFFWEYLVKSIQSYNDHATDNVFSDCDLTYALGKLSPGYEILELEEEYTNNLAAAASTDFEAYCLVALVISDQIREGEPVSKPFRNIAAQIIRGEFKAPKKPGRKRSENWRRDVLIVRAIQTADKMGIPVGENKAKRDNRLRAVKKGGAPLEPINACELVVQAFKEAGGPQISYETVLPVWKNRKKSGIQKAIQEFERAVFGSRRDDPEH